MNSEAWVQLALEVLSCSQKKLAQRLGVSPAQISKWKKNEYMSCEMEEKFREIVDIGDKDPSFVLWAGSLQEAIKWEKLIGFLANWASEEAETGYETYPLKDELGLLGWHTFSTLREMGVDLPKEFPKELDFDYDSIFSESTSDSGSQELLDLLLDNPYSDIIYNIYKSLNDVYGFYAAYVYDLLNDEVLDLDNTIADDIEPCLLELAACKIEADEGLAPKFMKFRNYVMKIYEERISLVKERAYRTGTPLRAELMELVYDSSEELGNEAEAESLGFNSSRLHPDIYMNEILCGIRMIHQVLPAIMKKLGIYDEFKLDTSELRIR